MSLFDEQNMCCIYGCHYLASHTDGRGNKFCEDHWKEKLLEEPECEKGCDGCAACTPPPRCAIPHCINPGPFVMDMGGLYFCPKHLWKSNRPGDSLNHPNTAQWTSEDELRAHGMGITIKEEKK
jgi:hypothetical protein